MLAAVVLLVDRISRLCWCRVEPNRTEPNRTSASEKVPLLQVEAVDGKTSG